MTQQHFPLDEAHVRLATNEKISSEARRAARWFPWFVIVQACFALSFTVSVDVFHTPYWSAFVPMLLGTASIWLVALLRRRSAPRDGIRNMEIAVVTWFVLYTWMLDPALQLVGATSSWWWVLAGVVAVSPILVCLSASSRR
ncbi:hypothetical protein [Plantibacter sp. ME-Dv--P-122b]|uniref:hypothetical protein n=1 Tax=Plantibacter sp. ME-Dv--P-122b TaxID=3040300 RepID=UPI00254ED071|nr:hypothetical protein [Plantibacter sp. ME-Dv--P-122b]